MAVVRFGLATIDHFVPSHRSTSVDSAALSAVPANESPTAKHSVVLGHAMSERSLTGAPDRFGLDTSDHFVPFHRSIKVFVALDVVYWPTAKQLDELVQDAADSWLVDAPVGFTVVVTDHEPPFQRSARRVCVDGVSSTPTARQLVVLTHVTPFRTPYVAPETGPTTVHTGAAAAGAAAASVAATAAVTVHATARRRRIGPPWNPLRRSA
jgi:hypothetical protein